MRPPLVYVPIGASRRVDGAALAACCATGIARHAANVREKTHDRNYSGRAGPAIHIQGVLGERAFAAMFGLADMTWDTTCVSARNDRFDARLGGKTVDVKATIRLDNGILVSQWKRANPADLYALMHLVHYDEGIAARPLRADDYVDVVFRGLIAGRVLFTPEFARDFNGAPSYYAPLPRLRPLHDLLALWRCDADEEVV